MHPPCYDGLWRGQFRIPAERTTGPTDRSSSGHREGDVVAEDVPLDTGLCCDLSVPQFPIVSARDENMSVGCPVCIDGVVVGPDLVEDLSAHCRGLGLHEL